MQWCKSNVSECWNGKYVACQLRYVTHADVWGQTSWWMWWNVDSADLSAERKARRRTKSFSRKISNRLVGVQVSENRMGWTEYTDILKIHFDWPCRILLWINKFSCQLNYFSLPLNTIPIALLCHRSPAKTFDLNAPSPLEIWSARSAYLWYYGFFSCKTCFWMPTVYSPTKFHEQVPFIYHPKVVNVKFHGSRSLLACLPRKMLKKAQRRASKNPINSHWSLSTCNVFLICSGTLCSKQMFRISGEFAILFLIRRFCPNGH